MKEIIILAFILLLPLVHLSATENRDKPLKGHWDLEMKKIRQMESAGDDVFGSIQNIVAAKNGWLYILDDKNEKIYIFNKEGNFISAFGRKGEGPGEIRAFGAGKQLFAVADTLVYADRGTLHYFNLEGKYIKSVRIPGHLKPRTFVSRDIFISAPPTMGYTRNGKAEILLFDAGKQSETVITSFTPFDKAYTNKTTGKQSVGVGIVIEDITPLMIVKYRDGYVYYGMSDVYQITKHRLEGNQKAAFTLNGRSRKPVSKAYKMELEKSLRGIQPDMLKRIMDGLPDMASFFHGIAIDKNGLIYVFVSDPANRSGRGIDIFSPEGKYLYSSQIRIAPGQTIYALYLRDRQLVIAIEDEEGELTVAAYSIQLPKS
jgi:hypothetical protein